MLKRYRKPGLFLLFVLGVALVVSGVGMYSRPAGFIVAGVFVGGFAVLAMGNVKQRGDGK